MTTFWLNTRSKKATSSNPTGSTEDDIADMLPNSQLSETKVDVEKERLIDWVCELLLAHIKKIIASRGAASSNSACIELVGKSESIPMDEVVEAIVLPEFEKCNMTPQNLNSVEIDDLVMTQLRNFISTIAGTYRDNSFHNFEVRNCFLV